jgi:hypothetical protein
MILLLGFNKSGTTSFQYLFKKLGYESHHFFFTIHGEESFLVSDLMRYTYNHNIPLLSFIPQHLHDNIAITQMDACFSNENNFWPQITHYQQLHRENPNALFILNRRDPQNLLQSFKNWRPNWKPLKGMSLFERIFTYNPEFFQAFQHLPTQEEQFLAFAEKHYQNIEDYFHAHPEAKFVSFDIEKDKLEKLAPYMDLKGLDNFPNIKPT